MIWHTSGPLLAIDFGNSWEWDVVKRDEACESGYWFVAQCSDEPGDGTAKANAHLFAAAPDLLEALQMMLEQFTKTPSTLKDTEARGKAHAAIAKATGGAA